MTASTDFLPFATGSGANVESQSTWISDSVVTNGFSAGLAQSAQVNKALRQATFIAAGLATWISQQIAGNVPDDGNLTNFITMLNAALGLAGSYMPIGGGTFTGTVSGPTPATSDNSTKLATTAMVHGVANPGVSIAANGYERRPSGLIEQWGALTITSGSNVTTTALTFPIAFPNACLGVVGNQTLAADGATWHPLVLGFLSQSATGCTIQSDTANSGISIAAGVSIDWRALGY